LNQGSCGSCWSFGTSEFASDRLCIASGGKVDHVLSPQFLVDCDDEIYPESGETGGCNGAMTQVVVDWISANGIVTDSCYPYFSGTTKDVGECRSTCVNEEKFQKYYFDSPLHFNWKVEQYPVDNLIRELHDNGPFYFSM